ncbi:4'-phosphopantetheinyl transferase family protein [Marinicella sediminis]|nr:4'-phosphopantetheinyl transferase superfamily protein [Marinicella sediminis]
MNSPPIASNQIDLWYVQDEAIVDAKVKSDCHGLLSAAEKSQMSRFYFAKDRHQYMVTRSLLRVVLSKYHKDVEPREWQFETNAYGRPYIANETQAPRVHFNISHAKNLVMLAIAQHEYLGVDVEYLERKGNWLDIADTFFSPDEVEQLLALEDLEKKKQRYFDLWTLKEAYVKACGMGLSIPLSDFSFIFNDEDELNIQFKTGRKDVPEKWRFWRIELSDEHAISLAIRREGAEEIAIQIKAALPLKGETNVEYTFRGHHQQ